MKVRFISNFPLSIVYGGFEHQCIQTCKALRTIGVDADLLNWHDKKEEDYILHLFAPDPKWSRIVEHWGHRGPVVISAIAGTRGFNSLSGRVRRTTNCLAQLLHQETTYHRTRKMLQNIDKIICLNFLEQDYFVKNYLLSPEKVRIIGNGVDISRFSVPKDIFVAKYGWSDFVLYVGSITHRKNPLLLAKCLVQLGIKGVFIGGEMPMEREYCKSFRKIVAQYPNLRWIPGLKYDEPILGSAFSAAKVLCLPSTAETQPLCALEAMAAGKTVILGDFPYAYQSPFERAIKVDPCDKEQVESAIQNAINKNDFVTERLSTEYTWDSVARKIAQVYLELNGSVL